MQKQTNPLIWGAVAAAIATLIVIASDLAGTQMPPNPLLDNPMTAAGAAFFWGWAAGSVKVWLGRRGQ